MTAKDRLNGLKKQFERLRKDSVAAVGTANEAVYAGLQKFADKELKALHEYYDSALASIKSQKKSGSGLKSILQTQFDLMQETVNRMMVHARESIEAAADKADVAPPASKAAVKKAAKKVAVKKAVAKAPAKKVAAVKKSAVKKASTKKAAVRKEAAPAPAAAAPKKRAAAKKKVAAPVAAPAATTPPESV